MSSRAKKTKLGHSDVDLEKSVEVGAAIAKDAGVPCALIGGLAVSTYVPPNYARYTKDADLAVPYGYRPAIISSGRNIGVTPHELSIGGYGFRRDNVVVDLVDRHPDYSKLYYAAIRDAKKKIKLNSTTVRVVSVPYLIVMKLAGQRQKDEQDIEALLRHYPVGKYEGVRRLTEEHLGKAMVTYLDGIARRISHPKVPSRWGEES